MGIAAVLDKAGPALATGIVLALLTGAASVVVAWRDLSSASAVRFSHIATELERIRADFESFRAPGGRFTKHDGDRLASEIQRLDDRVRAQEMRPPRLNEALVEHEKECKQWHEMIIVHEQQLKHIVIEQSRLCDRLQACKENRR